MPFAFTQGRKRRGCLGKLTLERLYVRVLRHADYWHASKALWRTMMAVNGGFWLASRGPLPTLGRNWRSLLCGLASTQTKGGSLGVNSSVLEQLVDAMFQHDGLGRLTGAAPLLHIVRTPHHVICRCHAEMPESTVAEVAAVAAAPRGRPGAWAEEYARYLTLAASVSTLASVRAGPLFQFPESLGAQPDCVAINGENSELLVGSLDAWVEDAEDGTLMVAALADGRAASVCASVRASEHVHCAGVATAPNYRGHGLAGRAVIGWATMVRESGAEPFYATTFDNVPSQKVAGRLGPRLIGSEFSVFGAASTQ